MRRSLVLLVVVVLLAACSDTAPSPSGGSPGPTTSDLPSGPVGRIVFKRLDPLLGDTAIYTANPDGTNVQQLHPGPAENARWSPDGTQISFLCCDDGMPAHLLDPDTGDVRGLPPPDPTLETFCGGPWSPDGRRLTCASFGVDDPSRNGIYSIRASDGGGPQRITSNPGGEDLPGDYSPDGKRLVFVRSDKDGPVGIFVINVDGTGLRQITPPDMIIDDSGFAGRWSPSGSQILLVARTDADHHKAIWIADAAGGSPEQLPITPACGGPSSVPGEFGCYSPDWSPDGERIIFARFNGAAENIYIVNADGTGLVQVTQGEDDQPDWGSHP